MVLHGTDFLDTVAAPGDASAALQSYVEAGGALLVVGGGAAMSRPLRWDGATWATMPAPLRRANLLVGLGLLDAGTALYQPPPAGSTFAMQIPPALAGRIPAQLALPATDQPFRFLPAEQLGKVRVSSIAELVDGEGTHHGAGLALAQQVAEGGAGPVCYVWAPLLTGDLAGQLLLGLANYRAETARLLAEAEQRFAGEPVKTGDAAYLDHPQTVVALQFNKGVVYLELWPDIAPKHAASFETLLGQQFYDGIFVHRVEPGFVMQAGDPVTKQIGGPSGPGVGGGGPGYTLPAEFSDKLHIKGSLSMARTADPNSAGSQFFICLDRASHLDRNYTIFGQVLGAGMDIVDQLRVGDRIVHGWVVKPGPKPAE